MWDQHEIALKENKEIRDQYEKFRLQIIAKNTKLKICLIDIDVSAKPNREDEMTKCLNTFTEN